MANLPSNMIGIGTAGNVGTYNPVFDTWVDLGNIGGWTLKTLAKEGRDRDHPRGGNRRQCRRLVGNRLER